MKLLFLFCTFTPTPTDYGINNGDDTYVHKTESAIAFINFLSSQRSGTDLSIMAERAASGKGVYGVKVLDFARARGHQLLTDEQAGLEVGLNQEGGNLSNRSVAIFLLDVRSNKSPWNKHWKEKYHVNYTADFLGREQWEWLEHGLSKSTATVNIIVSGLQVHADRYYNGNSVEDWSRFPLSQHRLYQAILQGGAKKDNKNPSSVVIVSGDVHMAELLRKDCRRAHSEKTRVLLEVTSSGMTHSWGTNICARPTLSLICQTPYFAWCLKMGMHWAHKSLAWTDVVITDQVEENARQGVQYALERNFGEFEFDWENRRMLVRVMGQHLDHRQVMLSTSWDFDLLSGKNAPEQTDTLSTTDYEGVYESLSSHGVQENDWICVNYGGQPSAFLKFYGAFSPIFLSGFLALFPVVFPLIISCMMMRRQSRRKSP